jgi:L-fucose isomerase
VQAKLLRFARAGLAAAILRGKSYLSLGGVSMGIAGSIVDQSFFEKYLGMRVECVDMSELTRRLEEGIYDPVEFQKALAWTKASCTEGADRNPPDKARSREEKDRDWETVVKMTLITRDLLVGNRFVSRGDEEATQRHPRRFQASAWTTTPHGDFMRPSSTSFD